MRSIINRKGLGFLYLFCLALALLGVPFAHAVQAATAPTTVLTTENDFGKGGFKQNGNIFSGSTTATPSGQSMSGYLAASRLTNAGSALGDFQVDDSALTVPRLGAAAIIARGPVRAGPAADDTNKYIYVIGGLDGDGTTALGSVERAPILADGTVGVFDSANVGGAGVARSLVIPRYGASVVIYGDFVYVIGGYDAAGTPVGSVERATIDAGGNLGAFTPIFGGPSFIGDQAAIIVGGRIYLVGGSTSPRGATGTRSASGFGWGVHVDGFWYDGFALPSLPAATSGGRLAVAHVRISGTDYDVLYYVGGNVSDGVNGATSNVYSLLVDSETGTTAGSWTLAGTLNSGRELAGVCISNGYLYVIGGKSWIIGATTAFGTVERAAVNADGTLGAFSVVPGTFINDGVGIADMSALADDGHIYVPGGTDIVNGSKDELLTLDLNPASTASAVPGYGMLDPIIDFGADMDINNLRLTIDEGAADDVRVRFRTAADGAAWSAWSNYVDVKALPYDPTDPGSGTANRVHLLDLAWSSGATGACDGLVHNTSGVSGSISGVRYLEYEVVIAGVAAKFNELAINVPTFYYATPGGYDPLNDGTEGNPCRPNNAVADLDVNAGTDIALSDRWMTVYGSSFPVGVAASDFALTATDGGPAITIAAATLVDQGQVDLQLSIPAQAGGPYHYDLSTVNGGGEGAFTLVETFEDALTVYPAVTLSGIDLDLSTGGSQNVVTQGDSLTAAILGANFRSGRVTQSGNQMVTDNTSATLANGLDATIRYRITDATFAGQIESGGWVSVGPDPSDPLAAGFQGAGQFNAALSLPANATTGFHELTIEVINPQELGSNESIINQTVYVVPKYQDPTIVFNLRDSNSPELMGTSYPARANLGDGIPWVWPITGLDILVWGGTGFTDSTGNLLVSNVTYDPTAGVTVLSVNPFTSTYFEAWTQVANSLTTLTGLHLVNFDWSYTPGSGSDRGPGSIAPSPNSAVTHLFRPAYSSNLGVFVNPPPPDVDGVFGEALSWYPVLMQNDPKLTINGEGFATGSPAVGFTSVVTEVRLVSMANPGAEDIVAAMWNVTSDRQMEAWFNVPANQRPGSIYQIQVTTSVGVPPVVRVSTLYPSSYPYITVVMSPTVSSVTRTGGSCVAAYQGETNVPVVITGGNFNRGAAVNMGSGITVHNLVVKKSATDTAIVDGETGDKIECQIDIAANAAPGAHDVVVNNGTAYGMAQTATAATQIVVAPVPTVTSVQPDKVSQPTDQQGTSHEVFTITGSNFTSNAVVSTTATGVTIEGVVADGSTLYAIAEISRNASPGYYRVRVTEPSGSCLAASFDDYSGITVVATPQIGSSTISPDYVTLGQGPATITITGNGLASITQGVISNGGLSYALSGIVATATSVTATVPDIPYSALVGKENRFGTYWDVTLKDATGIIAAESIDQFTLSAGTTVVSPETPQYACQGSTGTLVVSGTNFLANLTPANISLGQGVNVNSVSAGGGEQEAPGTVLTITYTVADDFVSYGGHSLTITNPWPENSVVASTAPVLTVTPTMQIANVTPGLLVQGGSYHLEINGLNFTPQTVVSFWPPIDPGNYTITTVNEKFIEVWLDVPAGFTPGNLDVVVGEAEGGSCAEATYHIAVKSNPAAQNPDRTICQGRSDSFTVTGANFVNKPSVSFGEGIAVNRVTFNTSSTITVYVTAADDYMSYGSHMMTITNPDGGSVTVNDALTVTPTVQIANVTPEYLAQGQVVTLEINGLNFVPGSTVSVTPSTGLVLGTPTVTEKHIGVQVTVAADAPPTDRTLTVTSDGGSCSQATFHIEVGSVPTVTGVYGPPNEEEEPPAVVCQGRSLEITVHGTSFYATPKVSFGEGIAVNKVVYNSYSIITVNITAADDYMSYGSHMMTITNPDGGTVTVNDALTVTPTPQIANVTPAVLEQGGRYHIEINGLNFTPETQVTFWPPIDPQNYQIDTLNEKFIDLWLDLPSDFPPGNLDVIVGGEIDGENGNGDHGDDCNFATYHIQVKSKPTAQNPDRTICQGRSDSFVVKGTSFYPTPKVTFGEGIAVNKVVYNSYSTITVNVTAADDYMSYGKHMMTVTNPDGGTVTVNDALTVTPTVQIANVTPEILEQGGNYHLEINGLNFTEDVQVYAYPSDGTLDGGVHVGQQWAGGPTTYITEKHIGIPVVVDSDAHIGDYEVIVRSGEDGDCNVATYHIRVKSKPTADNPDEDVCQGRDETLYVFGTNFMEGLKVDFGEGIAVNEVVYIDSTSIEVEVTAADDYLSLGEHMMTITNPDGGTVTVADALEVTPTPQIANITPAVIAQGGTYSMEINGLNFTEDAVVQIAGSGLNIGPLSITEKHISFTMTVDPGATVGITQVTVVSVDSHGGGDGEDGHHDDECNTASYNIQVNSAPYADNPEETMCQGTKKTFSVYGYEFQEGAVVDFGEGITVNIYEVISPEEVLVTITAADDFQSVCSHPMTVTNPDGGKVTVQQALQVTPSPQVANISPDWFYSAGEHTASINGLNFVEGSTVDVTPSGGVSAEVVTVNEKHIVVKLTISGDCEAGYRKVTVTSGGGECSQASYSVFVSSMPAAEVTGATLCQGATATVGITGSNFEDAPYVSFGEGINVNSVRYNDPTSLTVEVTAANDFLSVGKHAMTVINPDGSSVTVEDALTVTSTPTVYELSPWNIATGSTKQFTLSGANFMQGLSVTLSEDDLEVVSIDKVTEKQILITVKAEDDASVEPCDLVVTNPDGGECSGFTLAGAINIVAAPKVVSIDPCTRGRGQVDQSLAINGANFANGIEIEILTPGMIFSETGETEIHVTGGSSTRLTVLVDIASDAPTGRVDFLFTNPGGGSFDTRTLPNALFSITVQNQPTPCTDLDVELLPRGQALLTWESAGYSAREFYLETRQGSKPWTSRRVYATKGADGSNSLLVRGMKAGTSYAFRVRTFNKSGKQTLLSDPSNEMMIMTDGRIMSAEKASALSASKTGGGVALGWTNNCRSARSVEIIRSAKGQKAAVVATLAGDATGWVDTTAAPGKLYTYKVRVLNMTNSIDSTPLKVKL